MLKKIAMLSAFAFVAHAGLAMAEEKTETKTETSADGSMKKSAHLLLLCSFFIGI
jgi:hypothetical protein